MISFGVQIAQEGYDYGTIIKIVLECERLGFDSIWLTDHFFFSEKPYLECWTTLASLALNTSRLRLGTLVLCNNFRHPSLLAKMAATLDVISKGRLEFGIGAGWHEPEYTAYGIAFPKARIRIQMLEEGVQVIKKMWTDEKPSFQGKYYTIKEAVCNPKPVQRPHPPILIGGGGEKYLLRTVAAYADVWNIVGGIPPQEYQRKVKIIRKYCEEIKRDPKTIRLSWQGRFIIGNDEAEVLEKVRRFSNTNGMTQDEALKFLTVADTPDRALEKIASYADLGVTYFIMYFPDAESLTDLRLFAEQVIPYFKGY